MTHGRGTERIKVLIIGDRFMTPEILAQALRRQMGMKRVLEVVQMQVDWPDTPFTDGSDIREYVGSPGDVAQLAADVDLIVTHVGPVNRQVIEGATHLRAIGVTRGGPLNVDVKAATARRIPVINAPGRNARAVAEFTVGLILCETRSIARSHADLAQEKWRGDLYRFDKVAPELASLTVGLVGFGHVGRLVAELLRGFGTRVVVYDPYAPWDPQVGSVERALTLEDLLERADVVSLHARLTPETYHLIDRAALSRMRRGSYLINTARGGLVDYAALEEALRAGHLSGAALDTFDPEPPPAGSPLLKLPNVTVTPHIAGASKQTAERGAHQIAEQIANFLEGRPVTACVNPEVFAER
jgi:D-3-phosphoglycerate dehydrogenase